MTEEKAAPDPYLCEGIEHIAEAAQRDGAQVSAHDQALLSRYAELPPAELYRRRDALRSEARVEHDADRSREQLEERTTEAEAALDRLTDRIAEAAQLPKRERRPELARLEAEVRLRGEEVERMRAERAAQSPAAHESRAEMAAVEHLIATRERRRPSLPARVHRQGAWAAPKRSVKAQGLGSCRQQDRELSAAERDRGQERGAGTGAEAGG